MYDYGSTHTLETLAFVKQAKLDMLPFHGTFKVATDKSEKYQGQLKNTTINLSKDVQFTIPSLRVISGSEPKIILGNDVIAAQNEPSF